MFSTFRRPCLWTSSVQIGQPIIFFTSLTITISRGPRPQCYRQWVYKAPLCITLRIKTWVVAYLKFIIIFFRIFKNFLNFILGNFLVRTLQSFQKNFLPQKRWKKHPQSCSEKLKATFFPYYPELPKRPKQKNSCFKM